MPTYDYECSACGETLEIFQSITEEPQTKCPKCGKKKLRRLIGSGAGFLFKGSGFYITDYRSADYQAKAKADAGGEGASKEAKPASSGGDGASKSSGSTGSTGSSGSSSASKD